MAARRSLARGLVAAAVLPLLWACQAAPPSPAASSVPTRRVSAEGVGTVLFAAPVAVRSSELLMGDMEQLIAAGARTIRLAINSPGGDIDAARRIVDYMNSAHAARGIEFEAYDVGMMASAATYIFLNAQRRYARATSGFLFHAAGMVSTGAVSAERLREAADKLDVYERAVRAVLKTRTRLTDGAIDVYLHRIVILTADDARRDGVVDGIRDFVVPPGTQVAAITVRTTPGPATAASPTPPAPPPGGGR